METTPPQRRPSGSRRTVQITDRDRQLLAFAAENRFVIAGQVDMLLELTDGATDARMRALSRAGYLVRERRLHAQPATLQITRQGLKAIGSDLPVPRRLDLAAYHHELGVGWLMVMARRGRFGPLQAVISERRMRSEDGRRARRQRALETESDDSSPTPADGGAGTQARHRHGVRLGGSGPHGNERLHYPDLVLIADTGHRIALELELTSKGRDRREGIMAGYAADAGIDMVIYLVDRPTAGVALTRSAARLGVSHLVRVQSVATAREPRPSAGGGVAQRHRVPTAVGGRPAGGPVR